MGKPDALSRRADHNNGQDDNSDVTLLKPELFINAIRRQGQVEVSTGMDEILKQMRRREIDEEGRRCLELEGREAKMNQGLLMVKGKVYVPKEYRREVMRKHHESVDAGHPGQTKTIELITQNYWWPTLNIDTKNFVRQCLRCQQTKSFPTKHMGLLIPNPVPTAPWEDVTVDMIVGLPDSQGYDAILVVVDRFTKMIHALAVTATISAEGGLLQALPR